MLGMGRGDSIDQVLFEPGQAGAHVRTSGIFPTAPLLSLKEWQEIKDYFLSQAPVQLPSPQLDPIEQDLSDFAVRIPQIRMNPPSSTLVQISTSGGLYLGDAHSRRLYRFDAQLRLQQTAQTQEGVIHLIERPEYIYLTQMGSFAPTDADTGLFMVLPLKQNRTPEIILPALQRPVHTRMADLTGDNSPELIISEFGKWTGSLSWWKNKGPEGMERHVLRNKAGATSSHVADFNADGRPDILALFAQGEEGVYLYENQGEEVFREQKVLSFPPSYGLSHMELIDWNKDGRMDLLICAGDNADYPAILKPYHGIYLYLNEGNYTFTQQWFYAMPGAYGTQTHDFDLDGDLDIAAISFFPDYQSNSPRDFVLLKNQGKDTFSTQTLPKSAEMGRWICMDAGDIDKDGDMDIVLGSLAFEVIGSQTWLHAWTQSGIPFLVLENMAKE